MLNIIRSVSLIGLVGSILSASVLAVPLSPKMKVLSAKYANVKAGDLVPVGKKIHTTGVKITSGSASFGGTATLSFTDWGVSRIAMTPNSDMTLSSFGYCFGGGRTSQFEVNGEIYFTTRPKTHYCTNVIVCVEFSKGCVELSSNIAIVPLKSGLSLIGVSEGTVRGIKRLTTKEQVTIKAGEFSTVNKGGDFTPPKRMSREFLVTARPVTKTLIAYEVPEGFSLKAGNITAQKITLPNGVEPALVTPFNKTATVNN